MMELWKKITRVPGNYEVSSYGRIRNANTGKILKLNDASGYLGVTVNYERKSYRLRTHRCVAEEFVTGNFPGAVVNHKDGIKHNNNIQNLEWTTSSENIQHAYDIGLRDAKFGIENLNSKLSAGDVEEIRKNYKSRDRQFGCRALAKFYKVHHSVISDIINNKRY